MIKKKKKKMQRAIFQPRSPRIPHYTKITTPSIRGTMTCISCRDSKPIIGGQIKTIVGGLGYSTSYTTCKLIHTIGAPKGDIYIFIKKSN
jgi:hypothetical protein